VESEEDLNNVCVPIEFITIIKTGDEFELIFSNDFPKNYISIKTDLNSLDKLHTEIENILIDRQIEEDNK